MWKHIATEINRDDLNNNYFYNLKFTRVLPDEVVEQHFKFFCSPFEVSQEDLREKVLANLRILNPVPSITENLERAKEALKMDLFGYIKANPETTLEQTLQYVSATFGWPDEALTRRLIYEYAKNAFEMGLLEYSAEEPEAMFNSLRDFLAPLTEDQLLELVGP